MRANKAYALCRDKVQYIICHTRLLYAVLHNLDPMDLAGYCFVDIDRKLTSMSRKEFIKYAFEKGRMPKLKEDNVKQYYETVILFV